MSRPVARIPQHVLEQAIVSMLTGDPVVAALFEDRIYSELRSDKLYPYIALGSWEHRVSTTKHSLVSVLTYQINLAFIGETSKAANEGADEVIRVLTSSKPPIAPGWEILEVPTLSGSSIGQAERDNQETTLFRIVLTVAWMIRQL